MILMYTQADAGVIRRTGWSKSTRSNPSQNCVEIQLDGPVARIRDSKNEMGPMLACAKQSLSVLVELIRDGQLTG